MRLNAFASTAVFARKNLDMLARTGLFLMAKYIGRCPNEFYMKLLQCGIAPVLAGSGSVYIF